MLARNCEVAGQMGWPASISGSSLPPARSRHRCGTDRRSLRDDAREPRRDVGLPGLHRSITVAAGGNIDETRRLGHAQTLAVVLIFANWTGWITCSPARGRYAEELLAISTEHRLPFHFGWETAFHGASLTALGQAHEGLTLLTQELETLRAILRVTNEWPLVAPAEFKRGQKARYALLEVVSCCEPRPRWERLRR